MKKNQKVHILQERLSKNIKKNNPADEVIELELYGMDVPLIDADVLNGWEKSRAGQPLTSEEARKVTAIHDFTHQFMNADKFIIQSSMWNLGIQPLLKAYFDTVMVAGQTFKYTAEGPVGLMKGKKAFIFMDQVVFTQTQQESNMLTHM